MGKGAKKSEAQSYSENTFVYMQQVCGVMVTRLTSGDLSICLGLLRYATSRGVVYGWQKLAEAILARRTPHRVKGRTGGTDTVLSISMKGREAASRYKSRHMRWQQNTAEPLSSSRLCIKPFRQSIHTYRMLVYVYVLLEPPCTEPYARWCGRRWW